MQRETDIHKLCWARKDDDYKFFRFEHLKALIIEHMGPAIKDISEINGALFLPRDALFNNYMIVINQGLCPIHKRGVMHGDLRGERVVLRNGFTYVIDFSHRTVEH
jgi:tRNA A-37 threonylcarbamoyl transferase component Bud32